MKFTAHRKLRRMAAGVLIVPLLALGVTACGTEGVKSANANSVILTVDKGGEISPQEFVDEFKSMYEDQTSASSVIDMEAAGQKVRVEGAVDWSDGTKAQMKMTAAGMDADMIMVDNMIYMKGIDPSGKYVKIDMDQMGDKLGVDYSKQMNPAESMDTFQDAITKVVYTGTEKIDDRELRHYEVTIDSAKLMAASGADDSVASGAGMPDTITEDIYLDEAGLLRRMEMKGEGSMPSMTMTIPEYGVAVDVTAPPSDQVTELPGLSKMMDSPAA